LRVDVHPVAECRERAREAVDVLLDAADAVGREAVADQEDAQGADGTPPAARRHGMICTCIPPDTQTQDSVSWSMQAFCMQNMAPIRFGSFGIGRTVVRGGQFHTMSAKPGYT